MEHTRIGKHGGASRASKLVRLIQRTTGMRHYGKGKGFDLAIAHGSNDIAIASRMLGIPEANMHDYEFAVMQHHVGCRLAKRVIFPESVPPERLKRFGVGPEKLFRYPGFKEEYYLADFEVDPGALEQVGVDTERVVVIVRPPPDVSLYHRKSNPLFPQVLARVGSDPGVHAVVLPRTEEQREYVKSLALPSLLVPDHAVEAQSLVALADLVVSAGGTMNREAVALGTPVYTTYGGRLGGVDEALIRSNRLRPLTDPRALELEKRTGERERIRRDPGLLVDLMLGAAEPDADQAEPRPSSVAEQYSDLAAEVYAPRRVDIALRGLDLIIAGSALVVLSPLLGLLALATLVTSGRPVLYRGQRVGRAGQVFTMYKLRTLKPGAESRLGPYYGEELSRRTEQEVTMVGRAARLTHIDEVPQLFNVLGGDMSMVGPRPVRPAFFNRLCEEVPQYWQRLVVRPGVTGFAQTRITREDSWEDKLIHDLEYIADRSIRLYLRVLGATITRIANLTVRGRDR